MCNPFPLYISIGHRTAWWDEKNAKWNKEIDQRKRLLSVSLYKYVYYKALIIYIEDYFIVRGISSFLLKKISRFFYSSQWEKEKYNNNHHGAHTTLSNLNNGLSNGNVTSGGNLILGGTTISSSSVTTSCSSGIDQPIINAHHAHSHPHMILPHVSSIASSGSNNVGSSGHLMHHPNAGQTDQLVDLRLSSTNGNSGSVDEYKRVAYLAAAVATSANDLKLLR